VRDGVHIVQASHLVESLEVVVIVDRFLIVIVVIAGCGCHPLRAPLAPVPATLGVLLGALDGDA
jgi:hypothetical protein